MTGRWVPDLALDREDGPSRVAELLRPARPILLDLAGRTDLADAAADWADRVDVVRATTAAPPAEAVLIRPDGYAAWAAGPEAPQGRGTLRRALGAWFGPARRTS